MNAFKWRKPSSICGIVLAANPGYSVSAHAKDIVMGQLTALTGVLASSGEPMRLGTQIHFRLQTR